jgi:hypothetical protein
MPPRDVLRRLTDAGCRAELDPAGRLLVRPACRLTDDLRDLIRRERDAIVQELRQSEFPPANDTEARLREIARMNGIDWREARKWLRDIDVLAAEPYLNSDDPRDREGLAHWLRLLADPNVVKLKPEWLDEMQRRPS